MLKYKHFCQFDQVLEYVHIWWHFAGWWGMYTWSWIITRTVLGSNECSDTNFWKKKKLVPTTYYQRQINQWYTTVCISEWRHIFRECPQKRVPLEYAGCFSLLVFTSTGVPITLLLCAHRYKHVPYYKNYMLDNFS